MEPVIIVVRGWQLSLYGDYPELEIVEAIQIGIGKYIVLIPDAAEEGEYSQVLVTGKNFFLTQPLALKALEEALASERKARYAEVAGLDHRLMKVREELKGQGHGDAKPRC